MNNIDETLKEFDEISKSENEIKNNIVKSNIYNGYFNKYVILDNNWYQKYKKYLIDILNGKTNQKFNFNIFEMKNKNDEKMICFLDKNYSYNFICKFIVVRENFIILLSKNFLTEKDKKKLNHLILFALIGGNCIIFKDETKTHNYITIYEEDKDNNIDFFLIIKDETQKKFI